MTNRERQVEEICIATTCHRFDERDCVRLIKQATGVDVPLPEDGEDYDMLADLSDADIAKIHAVVKSWEDQSK